MYTASSSFFSSNSNRLLISYLLLIPSLFIFTACGSSDSNQVVDSKKTDEITKTAVVKTQADTALDTSPIALNDIFDTSPPKYAPMSECPFLTDKTAMNTTHAYPHEKENPISSRKEVSNIYCLWLTDLEVRISPAKSASTHKKRVEAKPERFELKVQSGPGTEATVLYYKSPRLKPIVREFAFFQGDKYIVMKTIMRETSIEKLRRTADEIAKLLPNAPEIKPQTHKRVRKVELCDIWKPDALKTLFNVEKVVSSGSNSTFCKFNLYSPDNSYSLDLKLYFSDVKNKKKCRNYEEKHEYTREKDFKNYSVLTKTNESSNRTTHTVGVCSDQTLFDLSISSFFSTPNPVAKKASLEKYKKELHQLLENIATRIVVKDLPNRSQN